MLGNCLENVKKNVPLVYNITNYVTVNDVANALLAPSCLMIRRMWLRLLPFAKA